jgi:putative hydrolase of the HAD superfamily
MASEYSYASLLVDYSGVLTSNLFDSFRSFCELEGIAPDEIGRRFREDRSAGRLLIDLETAKLPQEEFEPQFTAMLGFDHVGLIDRLFARSTPDEPMLGAVLAARRHNIRRA